MPVHDDLGKRMKTYYEAIPKTSLMRRTPVAIRIDGKAFLFKKRNILFKERFRMGIRYEYAYTER